MPTRKAAGTSEGGYSWLTYVHLFDPDKYGPVTQLDSERRPSLGGYEPRPATQAEIAAEKRKRAIHAKEMEERRIFENRQEYKDAEAIRSLLELMTYDDNPLEYLTPREWAELRRKLGA